VTGDLNRRVELARQLWDTSSRSDRKATKLLLGKIEQAELIKMAEEDGYFHKPSRMLEKSDDARVEFRGLKVYSVDDESYVEVAP
jgi:hypothetical protein